MKCTLLLLTLGASLLVGCVSSTPNKAPDTTAEADSMVGDEEMPVAPPGMAPGTARVTAVVRKVQADEGAYQCTLEIQEVQGYGPSTPSLAVGAEVEAVLPMRLFDGETAAAEGLQTGQALNLTMRHQRAADAPNAAPYWQGVRLH